MDIAVVICICVTVVMCVFIISYFCFEASKQTYVGYNDYRNLLSRVETLEKKVIL